MKVLLPLLAVLARLTWRELSTLQSTAGNHFFLFAFFGLPRSGRFLQVVLGFALLFPLSADPLRRIPPARQQLWPLARRDLLLLRLSAMAMSPGVWVLVLILLYVARQYLGWDYLALAVVCVALAQFLGTARLNWPQIDFRRYVPGWPGVWGILFRKNLRELLQVLDSYPGWILALLAMGLGLAGQALNADARLGFTLLVVLSLSSYAQNQFALDGGSSYLRYRVWPCRGWQVLAAKDAALLFLVLIMNLPLAPLSAVGAALVAAGVGHHATVYARTPQKRWRFTAGSQLGLGLLQVGALFGAGTLVHRQGPAALLLCLLVYAVSLVIYGRLMETAKGSAVALSR